jgi:hypothetical protein
MNHEHSSEAFFELIRRELYTAVVGDVMDSIGFDYRRSVNARIGS